MLSPLHPCKTSVFTLPVPALQLTDDGCVVGPLAETERLQPRHQFLIHFANHQRFTLRTVRKSISQFGIVEQKEKFKFVFFCIDTKIPRFRFCTKTTRQWHYQQLPNECKILINESVCGTITAEGFYFTHTTHYVRRPQKHKLELYNYT